MVASPTIQHLIIERLRREMVEMQNINDPASLYFSNYYNPLNGFSIKTITESAVRPVDDINDALLPHVFFESGPSAIAERRLAQKYDSHFTIEIFVVVRAETGTEAVTRINNYYQHIVTPPITTGITDAGDLDVWQVRPDSIDADTGTVSTARRTFEDVYNAQSASPLFTGLSRAQAYDVIRFMQIKNLSAVISDVENAFKLIAFTMNATKIDKTIDHTGAVHDFYFTLQNEELVEAEFLSLIINQRDAGSNRRHLTVRLGFLCSKTEGGRV